MNASFASKDPGALAGRCSSCSPDLGADEYRPAPKFEGKSIPDPPRQKEPWTPPQTKLPRFLVSATAALFEQGDGRPARCEYREVEIGEGTIIKTRGFVLPRASGRGRPVRRQLGRRGLSRHSPSVRRPTSRRTSARWPSP